jgi:hypothetical protein
MVKVLAALSFWVWATMYLVFRTQDDSATLIVALTIAAFVLTHLLTISAPRFRIPIDVLCLVSIVGMFFAHRKRRMTYPGFDGTNTDKANILSSVRPRFSSVPSSRV